MVTLAAVKFPTKWMKCSFRNGTFPRKEGSIKSVSTSIPGKHAEIFVLPPPRLLVDASSAATMPTAVWVARVVDRVKLLLSMDGQEGDVGNTDVNVLQWLFVGNEIEKRLISSVREGRGGDILDLATLLRGVLYCETYPAELQAYFLNVLAEVA
jgi:hypothetical protein